MEATSIDSLIIKLSDKKVRQRYANTFADIRFGKVLEDLDNLAGDVAIAYAGSTVVTAALERMDFLHPVDTNYDLNCVAGINRVGSSSMEVGIRLENAGNHIANAYFTMVAVNPDGTPNKTLKPLEMKGKEAERRYQAALQRQKNRNQIPISRKPVTGAEQRHLAALEKKRKAHPRDYKKMTYSSFPESQYPEKLNGHGTIFGGYLMRRAFEIAWDTVTEYSDTRSVVASIDRVDFIKPVLPGAILQMDRTVCYVGDTSVNVQIGFTEKGENGHADVLTNKFSITFVGVDMKEDNTYSLAKMPKVAPRNKRETQLYVEGRRRHAFNKTK